MDNSNMNIIYSNTNFLGKTTTNPFTYEFRLDEKASKKIYLGEEINEELFELFILNLLSSNSLINKKIESNWSIVMYSFLLENFKKASAGQSKNLEPLKVILL
jgi:hypothetical protein